MPFKALNAAPHGAGAYTFDWDGRNPEGKVLADGAQAQCAVASLLRENHVITSGDTPHVSLVKTDPYELHLAYGQFTRITYTLSRDAAVTVKLISPDGTETTLVNGQLQAAGAHELEWNGVDPADAAGKEFVSTDEGDYTVWIQASSPITGASSVTRGNLKVRY